MSKIELGTKTMVTCSQLINDYYRLPFNFSNNHQKRRLIWYLRFYLWQLNHSRVSFDEAGDPRWNCTCWMFTMIERRYYIILRCYYFTRRHQISVSISSSATTRNNGRLIFVVVFRWFGEEYRQREYLWIQYTACIHFTHFLLSSVSHFDSIAPRPVKHRRCGFPLRYLFHFYFGEDLPWSLSLDNTSVVVKYTRIYNFPFISYW